jgi:glycosyltransferase 2 family protein
MQAFYRAGQADESPTNSVIILQGPISRFFMPEPQADSATPRPHAIYWIASLALAGVLLYYSLRGIEWDRVWSLVKGAHWEGVALSLSIMTVTLFLRAIRWRILLSAEKQVSVSLAFWATSAGYLGNNLLPARAGEVVRTMMVSARSGISRAFVLTTALSERVADAIVLITISGVTLITLPEKPGWLADAAKPFAVIGLCGVAGIAFVPVFESFWFRCLERIPVPHSIRDKVEDVLRQVLQGIRSFHDPRRLIGFLSLTAVIWFLDAETTVVVANSIGVGITLPVAFLLIAGLGLGSALPSTPGYVGIFQFVAVTILTPFGLSRTDAIAYILLLQALSYICVLTWGLSGLAWSRR